MRAISIPDSLQDYFNDPSLRSVVEHLLEQTDEHLPAGLGWQDVRTYHSARLAALKVRADFALLLLELWDTSWKLALERHGMDENSAWDMESMANYDGDPSPGRLWRERAFCRCYSYTGVRRRVFEMDTRVRIDPEQGIRLFLRIEDGEGQDVLPAQLQLPFPWEYERLEGYDFQATPRRFLLPARTGELEVSGLLTLANQALTCFMEWVH
ncbi:MAG: hypothetical protein KDI44_05125 [Thiothrix sp.]|nr:hypothetical protein [Thiothrix sp.]HPQ97699.1 hypothetical protein [Thiolinea sp.]